MKQLYLIKNCLTLLAMVFVLLSCERRPLEDELIITAKIPVKAYWDLAKIAPQNATVIIYKEDGSIYLEKGFSSNDTYAETEVALEIGSYTVFVFNELRDQIDYIRMRGHEKLATFEAYVTPVAKVYDTRNYANGDKMVNQPGALALAQATITVTKEMIDRTSSDLLTDLHPELKIATVNITAHIKGLNNARMPALAELRNMAESYSFATDQNSLVPVTTQFLMEKRAYYPDSFTDGTISVTLTSMGVFGDRTTVEDTPDNNVYLDILFQLVDAERTMITLSRDVTHDLDIIVEENKAITINLDIDMGILPNVKPEGSEDSGFDSEVSDWEGIEVPIII